jgi:site-specific recombinase XerC
MELTGFAKPQFSKAELDFHLKVFSDYDAHSRYPENRDARYAPHLRELSRAAGGELEQIQMLLGHASVQTTKLSRLA